MKFKLKFVRRYIRIGAIFTVTIIYRTSCTTRNEKEKPPSKNLQWRSSTPFLSTISFCVRFSVSLYKSLCPYLYVIYFLSENSIEISDIPFFFFNLLIFFSDRLKPSLSCLLESIMSIEQKIDCSFT